MRSWPSVKRATTMWKLFEPRSIAASRSPSLHRLGDRLDAERGIPHPQMLASNEACAENGAESPGSSLP